MFKKSIKPSLIFWAEKGLHTTFFGFTRMCLTRKPEKCGENGLRKEEEKRKKGRHGVPVTTESKKKTGVVKGTKGH